MGSFGLEPWLITTLRLYLILESLLSLLFHAFSLLPFGHDYGSFGVCLVKLNCASMKTLACHFSWILDIVKLQPQWYHRLALHFDVLALAILP